MDEPREVDHFTIPERFREDYDPPEFPADPHETTDTRYIDPRDVLDPYEYNEYLRQRRARRRRR